MPDLGQTVAEGKIVRWLKRPGEKVAKGEALLEVETDKVTMEVESYKAGYLRAILFEEGELAAAMSPIAILTDRPDEAYETRTGDAKKAGQSPDSASPPPGADSSGADGAARSPAAVVANDAATQPATPAAKSRANELGLDISLVTPSRPDGLVTRRDVESTLTSQRPSRSILPMAAVATKSVQTIPHFYVTVDADVSAMLAWRSRWNEDHPESRLSLNDIFVRARGSGAPRGPSAERPLFERSCRTAHRDRRAGCGSRRTRTDLGDGGRSYSAVLEGLRRRHAAGAERSRPRPS